MNTGATGFITVVEAVGVVGDTTGVVVAEVVTVSVAVEDGVDEAVDVCEVVALLVCGTFPGFAPT